MMPSLFFGIFLKCLIAEGSKTIPEKIIRSDATWKALSRSKPSFIIIKLLPQIMDSTMNINQFKKPLPNVLNLAQR